MSGQHRQGIGKSGLQVSEKRNDVVFPDPVRVEDRQTVGSRAIPVEAHHQAYVMPVGQGQKHRPHAAAVEKLDRHRFGPLFRGAFAPAQ